MYFDYEFQFCRALIALLYFILLIFCFLVLILNLIILQDDSAEVETSTYSCYRERFSFNKYLNNKYLKFLYFFPH